MYIIANIHDMTTLLKSNSVTLLSCVAEKAYLHWHWRAIENTVVSTGYPTPTEL